MLTPYHRLWSSSHYRTPVTIVDLDNPEGVVVGDIWRPRDRRYTSSILSYKSPTSQLHGSRFLTIFASGAQVAWERRSVPARGWFQDTQRPNFLVPTGTQPTAFHTAFGPTGVP